MTDARSLRPRTLLGIFDSATEIAVSSPGVAALAFLGAVPVAVLGVFLCYAAAEGVPLPGGMAGLALACGLATLWRFIPAGAASALILARLSGRDQSAAGAMREAVRKAPQLMAAGSLTLGFWALSLPFAMLPMLFSGGAFMTTPMVVDGAGPPWRLAGLGRRLLGQRVGAPGGLSLLWVMGVLVLALNLAGLLGLVLTLARSLANLELGYLGSLMSLENPIFMPALFALSFLLLEPVRLASLALLYVDAKSRKEGADLHAAMASLPAPKPRSARGPKAAALLLFLFVLTPQGIAANPLVKPGEPSVQKREAEDLRQDLSALGARAEANGTRASDAMDRLFRRVEKELEQGKHDVARRRLAAASEELDRVSSSPGRGEVDTRRIAREVLERREFRRVDPSDRRQFEVPETSLLDRFFDFLDRLLGKGDRSSRASSRSIDVDGLTQALWGFALVAFLILVMVLVTRALAARRAAAGEGDAEEPTEAPVVPSAPSPLGLDPLSRTPSAWLAEADRLASLGSHRLALRAAYLALLSQLHRVRLIDYLPTRTNWDHARSFRGPETQGRVFIDLTRRFDRAWYGQRSVGAEEYGAVRSRALSLFEDLPGSRSEGDALA